MAVEKKINTPSNDWPARQNLRLAAILSLVIAALAAGSSIAALLNPPQYYPSDLIQSLIPTDLATLFIILPILLGSLWLAQRRKLIGLLCWTGALFAVLYTFIPYLIAVPFNILSLVYIIVVPLSAATMIGLVANLDGEKILAHLQGRVSARISGGILTGLGILIIVRQTAMMVSALINHVPVPMLELSVWIADFAVASPAVLVAGIQLWRRKPFGYTTAGGLLLAYGALSIGLIPYFLLQPRYTGATLDVAGFIIILIMAALCLIPFGAFVRAAASNEQ